MFAQIGGGTFAGFHKFNLDLLGLLHEFINSPFGLGKLGFVLALLCQLETFPQDRDSLLKGSPQFKNVIDAPLVRINRRKFALCRFEFRTDRIDGLGGVIVGFLFRCFHWSWLLCWFGLVRSSSSEIHAAPLAQFAGGPPPVAGRLESDAAIVA